MRWDGRCVRFEVALAFGDGMANCVTAKWAFISVPVVALDMLHPLMSSRKLAIRCYTMLFKTSVWHEVAITILSCISVSA